jgi:hypothetical protein
MKTAIILLSLILSACGPYIKTHKVKEKNYTIGKVDTTSVGKPIFSVQLGKRWAYYEAMTEYIPPDPPSIFGNRYPPIEKGMKFGILEVQGDSILLVGSPDYTYAVEIGDPTVYSSIRHDFYHIWISPSGCFIRGPDHHKLDWTQDTIFRFDPIGDSTGYWLRIELVYSGLTGNTLKTEYHEYSGAWIRPAATTSMEYNLDESKIIMFESVKFEIIQATDSTLQYRIISDDGLPWLP